MVRRRTAAGPERRVSFARDEQQTLLRRRLTAAIATPIALLVVLGVVLGRQILVMADDARWVNHTNEILSLANETMLQIVDQETALRGYLIAGERQYLAPLERADPLGGFDRMQDLVDDNPTQMARFAEVRRRYERWRPSSTRP
jgi:methyl-accepting chemotaxis protein